LQTYRAVISTERCLECVWH